MAGTIDIVCKLYTPDEIWNGRTERDDAFKSQVRMSADMRDGVTVDACLAKMDRAGIDCSAPRRGQNAEDGA